MNYFSWDLIKSEGLKHYYNLQDQSLILGNTVCKPQIKLRYLLNIEDEDVTFKREKFLCTSVGCSTILESISELEAHMKARHTYFCSTCSLILPSYHLLDRHLLEIHDSFFYVLAQKEPLYACLLESCKLVFQNETERKEHCMKKHNFPNDFRFDLKWRKLPGQKLNNNNRHTKKMQNKSNNPDEIMSDIFNPPDEMECVFMEDIQECSSSQKNSAKPDNCTKVKMKIPPNFSFGMGVAKTFNRTHSYKNKHWHQKERTSKTKIEQISMKDLSEALDIVRSEKENIAEDILDC